MVSAYTDTFGGIRIAYNDTQEKLSVDSEGVLVFGVPTKKYRMFGMTGETVRKSEKPYDRKKTLITEVSLHHSAKA